MKNPLDCVRAKLNSSSPSLLLLALMLLEIAGPPFSVSNCSLPRIVKEFKLGVDIKNAIEHKRIIPMDAAAPRGGPRGGDPLRALPVVGAGSGSIALDITVY